LAENSKMSALPSTESAPPTEPAVSQHLSHRDPSIRVVLQPKDTNSQGTIFGGIILSYIDLAGAVECARTTRQRVVTVAVKEVQFKAPVFMGEVVSFYTRTTKVGKTSITVHVDVEVLRKHETIAVTEADLIFVCVDSEGNPTAVQPS
jgi:acyl-CoA thioesterase YciA